MALDTPLEEAQMSLCGLRFTTIIHRCNQVAIFSNASNDASVHSVFYNVTCNIRVQI